MNRAPVRLVLPTLLASLLCGPALALPLTEWGTQVVVSSADCPSFCTSFTFGPADGGLNQASGFSSVDTNRGNAQALAQLAAGTGLVVPTLKAEAYGEPLQSGSAFSTAFGVEGYTYTGLAPKTFSLDITLEGSVSDPTPLDGDTFIEAEIYVFEAENFFFSNDIPTLIFEAGAVVVDSTTLSIEDELNAIRQQTFTFELQPGQSVYLWANLDAEAQRDESFADAFSTLEFSFDDSEGLEAASVPEPGTLALLALAPGMAAAARRRRSSTRA
jgi:hypothetical protein